MATLTAAPPSRALQPTSIRKLIVVLALIGFPFSACLISGLKQVELPTHETGLPYRLVDAMPVWVGSRIFLHRQNPYSDEATREIDIRYYGTTLTPKDIHNGVNPMRFAYPPQTAIVWAWFAALPWNIASLLMLSLCAVLTAVSVPLWLSITDVKLNMQLTIACVLLSWPAMWGIRLEQVSLIVIPLIALACWFYKRERYALSGFLLALCTIKPQLCFLLIPWLTLRSITRQRRGFIFAVCATLSILSVASELLVPGCFKAWFAAIHYYRQEVHLHLPFPILACAVAALAAYALYRKREFGTGAALVLAVTIVLNPADPWTVYNYLLLVPAVLLIENRFVLVLVAFEYALPTLLIISCLWRAHAFGGVPGEFTVLPIAIAAALLYPSLMKDSRSFQLSPASS
ncbi:MAG TPA: glycosyltransferase family 87 protein [Silvibacterium sp.]|nr:glycosyltransferase family 87 protein [Silvibacterium sp.]